ncbi:MAG TPA: hypothetical protein VED19_01965 [Candidatus Nitrosopolaris sp.]|nr:hypothetical protein [Candidatus Nitrosopolaris sp.]
MVRGLIRHGISFGKGKAGNCLNKKTGWLSSVFRLLHPRMGSLKKRRKAKINRHKRRKKLRLHRHKKRTWQQ